MPLDPHQLNAAQEYLLEYPANSQEFDAALQHVTWVRDRHPELDGRCKEIIMNVLKRRRDESHTMSKLRGMA